MEFIIFIISIWATTLLLKHHKSPNINCQLATLPHGLSVDVLVTSVMILLFVIVELMQYFFMGFSEWAKLIWIISYVQTNSWHNNQLVEWIIKAIRGVRLMKPWEQKLRQYSFLESYSYKPSWLTNNTFMAAYINQYMDGQKESKPIKLDEEVKLAVFDAVRLIKDTKLKNGQVSLIENKVSRKLSWACRLKTHTQVIMVWHIATSLCEYKLPAGRSDPSKTIKNFHVATRLSKYLAYLVAFAPRLLPDHPCTAEYVFGKAIIEARDFFQGCNSMDDRVMKMERKGSGNSARENTIIELGARLGNQLANEIKEKDNIWKIMASFWVELVLYVAPSDRTEAHVEHLTRGGEFVTHLWALLSHGGIERDPHTWPCNALKRSKSF